MNRRKKQKSAKSSKKTADENNLDMAWLAVNNVIELTDEFCRKYLNDEYRELCEDMAWVVYEEALPLESGKPSSWASGIVHALGLVNCLHDSAQSPHMSSAEMAKGFGVSQGTMMAKSRIIRKELGLFPLNPDWCIPAMIKDNPLVWMLDVGGFMMDIRTAPRHIQEEAYRLGLIPFIPADNQEPEQESDNGAKIIKFPSGGDSASQTKPRQKQEDFGPDLFERLEK